METKSQARLAKLLEQLQQDPGLAEQIPGQEGKMVRQALDGEDVYSIAQNHRVSEERVWSILRDAARAANGQDFAEIETGGFGSDTDPGATGGYGDTGFGSLDTEPPLPDSEEPQGVS